MSNSPQENSISSSDPDSDETLAEGDSTAEGLVEDVLRDARSLLGEPLVAEEDAEEDADSMVDRPEVDAERLLDDLDRLSDELVAEVESRPIEAVSDGGLQPDGIKRGPAARDLGSEGPQVDLFGMAIPEEAPPSSPERSTVGETPTRETPAAIEVEPEAKNAEATNPAAALEALMASRIAEESEAEESVHSTLETPVSSMSTNEMEMADAAEQSAVATLDAMAANTPLRSTAGEVEAVPSGDPLARTDAGSTLPETPPIDSVSPAPMESPTSRLESIDPEDASDSTAESGETPDPSLEVAEAKDAPDAIEASTAPDSTTPEESAPPPSPAGTSPIVRFAALPFRLLPSSVHGLVSVAAISLVFWIPVAWTYAILGPEAYTSLLPSATAPADPSDPTMTTADDSSEVDRAPVDADQADAPSTR